MSAQRASSPTSPEAASTIPKVSAASASPGTTAAASTSGPASAAAGARTAVGLSNADVSRVVGQAWFLASVTENGRTWRPISQRPLSLRFTSRDAATTVDGANDQSWSLTWRNGQATWTPGWSTTAGEDAMSHQVGLATAAVLTGRPTLHVSRDQFVTSGPKGSLTWSTTDPGPSGPATGLAVYLDANPPGGTIARGQMLTLISGRVTMRGASGPAVTVQVSEDDMGLTLLPPGRYDVTAVVPGGRCKPGTGEVAKGEVTELGIVCQGKSLGAGPTPSAAASG